LAPNEKENPMIYPICYRSDDEMDSTLRRISWESRSLLTEVEAASINELTAAYARRGKLSKTEAGMLSGMASRLNARQAADPNRGSENGSDLIAMCAELGARKVPQPARRPREDEEEESEQQPPPRAARGNPGLIEMCRQRAAETGRAL
jgi:hypothetical protein